MRVITGINVNDVWPRAIEMLDQIGEASESRNGRVVVAPYPIATVYHRPTERVIFDPVRDANPFFHLHEALWMLAGRDDADWLNVFVSDFANRFAEEGGRMHGAYGKRWRDHFPLSGYEGWEGPSSGTEDQLNTCVRLLRENPDDRQAVIQMWNSTADLGVPGLKDRPCNTQVYLRVRRQDPYRGITDQNSADRELGIVEGRYSPVLDITVTCRSNDMVFGAYGANVVHFSVLQEYLAARIGVGVGTYTQFSNNFHCYDWARDKVDYASAAAWIQDAGHPGRYPGTDPLVTVPESFDAEVRAYVDDPTDLSLTYENVFLNRTAQPMWVANELRRRKDWDAAIGVAETIHAPDWRIACLGWLKRRAPRS